MTKRKLTLPLEVGKQYVRRDGYIVRAQKSYHTYPDTCVYVGLEKTPTSLPHEHALTANGRCYGIIESHRDIVADYPEVADTKSDDAELRKPAAIALRVPDSGVDWLDDMIRTSLRNELASKAMQSYLMGSDRGCFTYEQWASASYEMADAMLKAGGAQ